MRVRTTIAGIIALTCVSACASDSVCKPPADPKDSKAVKAFKKCRKEEDRLAGLYAQSRADRYGPEPVSIPAALSLVHDVLVFRHRDVGFTLISDSESLVVFSRTGRVDHWEWATLLVGNWAYQQYKLTLRYGLRQRGTQTEVSPSYELVFLDGWGHVTMPVDLRAEPKIVRELEALFLNVKADIELAPDRAAEATAEKAK